MAITKPGTCPAGVQMGRRQCCKPSMQHWLELTRLSQLSPLRRRRKATCWMSLLSCSTAPLWQPELPLKVFQQSLFCVSYSDYAQHPLHTQTLCCHATWMSCKSPAAGGQLHTMHHHGPYSLHCIADGTACCVSSQSRHFVDVCIGKNPDCSRSRLQLQS